MTTPNFIFEEDLRSKDEKIDFLRRHSGQLVIMDLTAFEKGYFFKKFPNLIAATSIHLNPTNKCEVTIKAHHEAVHHFLSSQGLLPVAVASLEGYFHLPRILSTIINEAYYSLEDDIASADDIDRAMKYGVNYPEGPFAWSKGKESFVVSLLDNLFDETKSERYKASRLLRERSVN